MNENRRLSHAWRQYEAGKEYKERIGLYARIRENERFYRGDQWYGSEGVALPKPVFNVIRRVVDYLVGSIGRSDVRIGYTDESLPFRDPALRASLSEALEVLSGAAEARWENDRMDRLVYRVLLDAAIAGDGVLYCYWDPERRTGQSFTGDVVTETVDSTNLFVADVNRPDLQSQEYVMLSGRASVRSLYEEAIGNGVPEREARRIRPDGEYPSGAGDLSRCELSGEENEKATYLLYFWRENGTVQGGRDLPCGHGAEALSRRVLQLDADEEQLSRHLPDLGADPESEIHQPRLCDGDEAYAGHGVLEGHLR